MTIKKKITMCVLDTRTAMKTIDFCMIESKPSGSVVPFVTPTQEHEAVLDFVFCERVKRWKLNGGGGGVKQSFGTVWFECF